jgi:hypothetical protein
MPLDRERRRPTYTFLLVDRHLFLAVPILPGELRHPLEYLAPANIILPENARTPSSSMLDVIKYRKHLPIQIDFGEAKTVAIVLSMIGLNYRLTQDMRNAAKMLGLVYLSIAQTTICAMKLAEPVLPSIKS